MRDSGRYPSEVPSFEKVRGLRFGTAEVEHLGRISNREVVGLPLDAKRLIVERAAKYDVDEVMLTMITHKLSDKNRSLSTARRGVLAGSEMSEPPTSPAERDRFELRS